MKEVFKVLARICDSLAWWFAGKAGMIKTETTDSGLEVRTCTFREGTKKGD